MIKNLLLLLLLLLIRTLNIRHGAIVENIVCRLYAQFNGGRF